MRRGESKALDNGGWSMVELMIALAILAVGLCGFLATITATISLTGVSYETAIATSTAQYAIEMLSNPDKFSNIFHLYNDDPSDDPDGVGTAQGSNIEGPSELQVQDNDPDGRTIQIIFPRGAADPPGYLRENVDDPDFGMPRDLNGNITDDNDGSNIMLTGGYIILPVKIRIEWKGVTGNRHLEISTLLSDR